MENKRIGIIGGTFDPIHNGHLILAEHSRVTFGLDKILFIPAGNPPHKVKSMISFDEHRLNMVLLAINSNPHYSLSPMEILKDGISYTVDTIRYLNEELKDSQLYFILGSDSLLEIHRWKDYSELLKLCNFIVANRGLTDDLDLKRRIEELSELNRDGIHILESPVIDISSTGIRNRIRNNLSIKYLVPESVESYIDKNNLYRG